MAISGQDIYDGKVRQFKMQSSHETFMADYLRALKCVAPQLALDLDDDAITVTDVDDSLDYETYVQPALEAGLDYWLVRFGHKSGDLNLATALQLYDIERANLRTYLILKGRRDLSDDDGAGQAGLVDEDE